MTQLWRNWVSKTHDNLWTLATKPHSVQVTTLTCFSAALQNWQRSIQSPETTQRSSSGEKKERSCGVAFNTALKEEAEVSWRLPGESVFLAVCLTETGKVLYCDSGVKKNASGQRITHQVEVVKYFGRSIHLSQSDQDFIVYIFLVGFQVKVQPTGQIVQHLQRQSKTI